MEADLMCVRELRRRDGRWRFFVATESPGDLPLMSIDETENYVKFVGNDIIESHILPDEDMWRLQRTPVRRRVGPGEDEYAIEFGPRRQDPEPFGIQLAKGPRSVAVTREFADKAMTWDICHELLNWLQVGFYLVIDDNCLNH